MDFPRILLFGKVGQVGWELRRTLAPLADVGGVDYPEINFTEPDSLRRGVPNAAGRGHQRGGLHGGGQGGKAKRRRRCRSTP